MLNLNLDKTFLRPLKSRTGFEFALFILLIFSVGNVLYKVRFDGKGVVIAENLWNPTWLLFGPILYYLFNSLTKHRLFISFYKVHFIPFYVYAALFAVDFLAVDFTKPWEDPMFVFYQNSFFVIPLSLFFYGGLIFWRRKTIDANLSRGELIFALTGIYMIIGILYVLMFICWGILSIDMGIDYRLFTYGFLLIVAVFILRYWYATRPVSSLTLAEAEIAYSNSNLKPEQAADFVERILNYFAAEESYLNPDISIELIAKDLNIPKYHFSQLFNVYIGKTFYVFIAERRIAYAIKRLNEEQGKIKIESLAYECGFNSKSSFNRYFKQIAGTTPLLYISSKEVDFDEMILAEGN